MNKCRPYERKIAYYETDKMGIVHHSNYIRWLEEARIQFLEDVGLDYKNLEDLGIVIPVLSAQCTYRQSFTFGDTFVVYPKVTKFNGIKMELDYEIYKKGSDVLHTTGHTAHCFLDKNMKPLVIKKVYPEVYQKFLSTLEN